MPTEETMTPPATPGQVMNWVSLRSIIRSGNIAHQNWKDARRLNGRQAPSEKGNDVVEDDMKINSPETHHHYPPPEKPQSLLKPLAGLAAAAMLGSSGIGAAYMVASALKDRPKVNNVEDTDSTLLQKFAPQDADWLKDE